MTTLASLGQDLRFAVRLLVRDRGFTAVATLALALGIGLNAAMFTIVNAILIRGLPFDEPDRFLYVGGRDLEHGGLVGVSWLDFQSWRDSQTSFVDLAAWSVGTMNVADEGQPPERYSGVYFSASAFKVIGVRPIRGRDFMPEDDTPGAAPVVVLSHDVWKRRYGLDESIIGRVIRVNDVPATVVGVMAEGMKFPDADLWMPLSNVPGLAAQPRQQRFGMQAFGRLAPGVSRRQAETELSAIAARLAHDFPATNKNIGATVMTFSERISVGAIRLVFLALMGAVGFVLLVVCANVANLLLVRSSARAKEMAIRVSIGATRWRIVRQLLVESLLLAGMGGVLGWLLAAGGIRWFDVATQGIGRPSFLQFTMDGRVVAFFAAVSLATAIIFGLAPALHLSKTDINDVIRTGGRGSGGRRARRWTSALVVGELTLTLVLLGGAGFMTRSFLALYRLDLGFETGHLLVMNLSLPDRKYPSPAARDAFYQRLDDRLGAARAIRAGTVASHLPFGGGVSMRLIIDGRPVPAEPAPPVTRVAVGPRYFDTLGLTLTRGRGFDDTDRQAGRDVGIVNQRLVSMYFDGENPIGRRVRLISDPPTDPQPEWITVVGVSPTIRQRHLREADPDPVIYVPYHLAPAPAMSLVVRTDGEPSAMASAMREEVRAVDPDLPLFGIATMDQNLAQMRWPYRVFGSMFSVFAIVALALSGVGLYAITAYAVTQRTQEIGIRMALGAQARQVWWLMVRRSVVQLGIGLTLGMVGALGVGRLLRSLLAQTEATDAVTLVAIAAIFVMVSIAACSWPARRAATVDPVRALRSE